MRLLIICLAFASALIEAGIRRLQSTGAGEFARGMRILLVRWDIEIMPAVTIRIPVELAHGLEGIAAAQQKSVQELAVGRLQSLLDQPTSQVLLRDRWCVRIRELEKCVASLE